MIVTAKIVAIFLGLATIAFCVSTIVLAVEKSNLEDELQDVRQKLDVLTAMTTTTTRATAPTSTSTITSTTLETTTTTITPTEITPSSSSSSTVTTTTSTKPTETTETSSTTVTTSTTTLAPGFQDPEKIVYRLPTDLQPIKYRLYFHPDLKARTSENTVSVQFEVKNVTNLIVMHAKDMQIDGISILQMNLRMRLSIKRFYLSEERELLIIELNELLRLATPYVVSIGYRNKLDGLNGIYASSYQDENGDIKASCIKSLFYVDTSNINLLII